MKKIFGILLVGGLFLFGLLYYFLIYSVDEPTPPPPPPLAQAPLAQAPLAPAAAPPPQRRFPRPTNGSIEYGGAFGRINYNKDVYNPLTGENTCPPGFLYNDVYGTSGVDHNATICYKLIKDPDTWTPSKGSAEFGGAYGWVSGLPVNNPATGRQSCPTGFTSSGVLGSAGVDWELSLCYKEIEDPNTWVPSEGSVEFGGAYGWKNAAETNNPHTNGRRCPTGFLNREVLGEPGVDYPLNMCMRPR